MGCEIDNEYTILLRTEVMTKIRYFYPASLFSVIPDCSVASYSIGWKCGFGKAGIYELKIETS
jgi:hypothetical protein